MDVGGELSGFSDGDALLAGVAVVALGSGISMDCRWREMAAEGILGRDNLYRIYFHDVLDIKFLLKGSPLAPRFC